MLSGYGDPRDLHSFPTRRSSDLVGRPMPDEAVLDDVRGGSRAGTALRVLGALAVLAEIGRAHVELQSHVNLVCRLLLEKKQVDQRVEQRKQRHLLPVDAPAARLE